jgi:cytochrome c551/c552
MTVVVTRAPFRPAGIFAVFVSAAASLAGQTPLESAVNRYCVTCHNDKLKTAGLSLSSAAAASSEALEKVLRKLRSGEMPPAGMPAPDAATRASLVQSLETRLDKDAAAHPDPGAPGVHRLNRADTATRCAISLESIWISARACRLTIPAMASTTSPTC